MDIRDLLTKEKIMPDLSSSDKFGILEELSKVLASNEDGIDQEILVEKLVERENLSSTGIGDGIAIPHCKYEGIDGILMSFGRSAKGIEFDSIDGKPAHIFFLLIAPNTQKAAGEHLRTLAKITRILKDSGFRDKLMAAKSDEDIFGLIAEEDEKY